MISNNNKLAIGLTILPILLFITLVMGVTSHDWETLASGFMSVGAAIWAGFLLSKQIQQTENHERERLKRKYIAARATLPLALTGINEYCVRSIDQLKPVYDYIQSQTSIVPKFEIVQVPDNAMSIINAMLESTPHEALADRLSEMLAMIQIFQSRIRWLKDTDFHRTLSVRDFAVVRYLINALEIMVTANSMFDYSRKKTDFNKSFELDPISYVKVFDMCHSLGMDTDHYEELHSTIKRYLDEGYRVNLSMFDSIF